MTITASARRLRAWVLRRTRRGGSADPLMAVLAIAVGLLTGLLAVALLAGVVVIQRLAFGSDLGAVTVLAPLLGGLIVGVIALRLPDIAGGGVSPVMTAVALHGGRMPAATAPAKLLASAISLGTGASGGREGPIVQIGGGVASVLGRTFALDDEQMRTLIAAAAGAGIAASFNAPLAGIFFAIEIIIGGYRVRSLQTVVIACVVASVTAREIVGAAITYQLADPPRFRSARELVLYVALGVAAALVGFAFARGEHLVAARVRRLRLWRPLITAVGAGAVGAIALWMPLVLGSGDHLPPTQTTVTEPVEAMLNGVLGDGLTGAGFLALLLVAKLVATALALGTGSSVGSFSPALFLGAALGGAFGEVADRWLRAVTIDPGAFALVGGAAVLAASAHAPLTAILLAFELTNDYAMVLPLMLATGVALFVSQRLDPESIYTRTLRERGIVYTEPTDVDLMQTVLVGEVMTREVPTVRDDLPLPQLIDRFSDGTHRGFVVIDADDRIAGVVTISDLSRPDARGLDEHLTAGDVATKRVVTVTPDDPMFRALRRMAAIDVGRIPVVAVNDQSKVVGIVRRADVVSAYQRAIARGVGVQQRRETSRLRDLAGLALIELTLAPDSELRGAALRDVSWPDRTIITSVRRGGDVLVPTGDTTLEAGDELVVLTDKESTEVLRRRVSGAGVTPT